MVDAFTTTSLFSGMPLELKKGNMSTKENNLKNLTCMRQSSWLKASP